MRGCDPPPPAEATQTAVALPPQSDADCSEKVPIVVASDVAAQSDLYSAVTLAGVIGTDCIILAGPRDQPMPADQQARLDLAASGGYIVGGTAAVPQDKLNFAQHTKISTRIAGADRWATATLVGIEATKAAGSTSPATLNQSAGAHLPNTDCAGDAPIIVASDAAAESDRYSAVTLAGVIGTDCIILAGPRLQPMPADQQERLAVAASGGYIVGGTAAVAPAKLAGRSMTRLAGADRWATAALVGAEATNVAEGSPTPPTPQVGDSDPEVADAEAAFAQRGSMNCILRSDGDARCAFRAFDFAIGESLAQLAFEVPGGPFSAVYPHLLPPLRGQHGTPLPSVCGLQAEGRVVCWTYDYYDRRTLARPVPWLTGTYVSLHHGPQDGVCGIRSDHTVICWTIARIDGEGSAERIDVVGGIPLGQFTSVEANWDVACGVRTDGTVSCWGETSHPLVAVAAPEGTFAEVVVFDTKACGTRLNGTVACWGDPQSRLVSETPTDTFKTIGFGGVNLHHPIACGIRTDGTATCWGDPQSPLVIRVPAGSFAAIDIHRSVACGIRGDRTVDCWGDNGTSRKLPMINGMFTAVSVVEIGTLGDDLAGVCGVMPDGAIGCAGDSRGYSTDYFAEMEHWIDQSATVGAPYAAISGGNTLCVLDRTEAFECWNLDGGTGG